MKFLIVITFIFISQFANAGIDLYEGPDKESKILDTIPEDHSFTILFPPKIEEKELQKDWLKIDDEGKTGWIKKEDVELTDSENSTYLYHFSHHYRVYAGFGSYQELQLSKKRWFRQSAGIELNLYNGILLGTFFDHYKFKYAENTIDRYSIFPIKAGYFFIPRRAYFFGYLGTQNISLQNHESKNETTYGAGLGYRHMLSRHFDITFELFWAYMPETVLINKNILQGKQPSEVENILCTVVSAGIANGCPKSYAKSKVSNTTTIVLTATIGFFGY